MAFTVHEILEDVSERGDDRREDRVFSVIADNDGESTYTARGADGLPVYGESHDTNNPGGNPNVRARRITAERVNRSLRVFRVTVEYEQFSVEITDEDDPLLDVTKVSYRRERTDAPYNRGLFLGNVYERLAEDGTTTLSTSPDEDIPYEPPADNDGFENMAVLNSAGEPFSDLPTRRRSSLTLICTRNEENVDMTIANQWQDVVNSDEFKGAEPGTLLLEIDVGDEETRGGVTFRPVTYLMQHRVEGWDDLIQDKGMKQLKLKDPGNPELGKKLVNIVDADDGTSESEPKLLNGEGQPLSKTYAGFAAGVVAVYRAYRPYTMRRPFADLELGI